jgi:tetratricopeptide (TPR) repeat protein
LIRKLKHIGLFILFAACFQLKAQAPFTIVNKAIATANYYDAETLLDSCKEASYFLDSVLYYKSLLHLKKGDLVLAKKLSAELQLSYSQFKEVFYLRGLINFVEGKYSKSIAEFNKLIKENPKHLKATYNRALAKALLEDHWSAIKDLSTCIEMAPNFAMAYYSRAYWYEYLGKKEKAQSDYEQCIRIDPSSFDAYLGLANVYSELKENEKACETITKAIKAGSLQAEELKANFCK